MNVNEIIEYKDWVVKRNNQRVFQQEEDQRFYVDDYTMPLIKDIKYQIKTGYVADMCNTVMNQLIGDNPRCYTESKNDKPNTVKSSDRVSAIGNKWLKYWLRSYSNPYRETFKDLFTRGEAWLYLPHNELLAKWDKSNGLWQEEMPNTCPVVPVFYDPIVVFTDPSTETNGQPSKVVVCYKRTVGDIKAHYPEWKPTSRHSVKESDLNEFFLYFDDKGIFAYYGSKKDGLPLFVDKKGEPVHGTGIRENICREVPFVHRYTGWGKSNASKDPDLLAYSRIRQMRGLIVEDSTMASDFSKNIHETAAPHRTLFLAQSAAAEFDKNTALAGYAPAPDTVSIVILPDGAAKDTFEVEKTLTYGAEVFAYAAQVRGRLNAKYPAPLHGVASGTSGRQEDILSDAGMSIYDCAMDNNELLWADAVALAVRIASNSELDILPPDLQETDHESYSEITVNLRKDDPVAEARKVATVERQWQNGLITHVRALMELGYEKQEAEDMSDDAWIEMVMRNDPSIVQMIVQIMSQEMGEEDRMAQIQSAVKGANPTANIGSQGGPPRTGNIQSATGMEQADMGGVRAGRLPPGV